MPTNPPLPMLSRPFVVGDRMIGVLGDYRSKSPASCCAAGWSCWLDIQLGENHRQAVMFWRSIPRMGGSRITWSDSCTDAEWVRGMNAAARKAGPLPPAKGRKGKRS